MTDEEIQAHRRTRLEALAAKFDGKAELGRRLKYRDGAFVGQMIAGLRPITEKTVRAAEALPGCSGWFAGTAGTSARPKGAIFEDLSTEERELVSHWRHLLGKDRRAKLEEIAALAQERLAERDELFAEAGITRIQQQAASSMRGAQALTVEPGGKLRQRSLLDEEASPRGKS